MQVKYSTISRFSVAKGNEAGALSAFDKGNLGFRDCSSARCYHTGDFLMFFDPYSESLKLKYSVLPA